MEFYMSLLEFKRDLNNVCFQIGKVIFYMVQALSNSFIFSLTCILFMLLPQ